MQWSHPRGLGILFSVLASGLLIGVFLSGSHTPSVGHVDASAFTAAAFVRRPSKPAFFFSRSR